MDKKHITQLIINNSYRDENSNGILRTLSAEQIDKLANDLHKNLTIQRVSDMFSADDMKKAFEDGEHYGKGGDALVFDVENYS